MAMFNGASNVTVLGGSFVANAATNLSRPSLDKIVAEVAPNAILNAGGRADEVRCFPGTREEVIGKLEKFMDDDSPGRKRMMWLSGPAGAGKSAICQTLAERRSEQQRHAANFFFFRGDSTCRHAKPLVPTLVYQLRQVYPALDGPLVDCLETTPLICSASIEAQFKQIISSPIQIIQESTPFQQQIVIIVDGLDECNNDEREQDQIIVALHTLAHADNSPFLILVSSRAESQLVMSFNRLGSSVESIFLNEDYRPAKDIRFFVVAKFAEIRKNHHLARSLNKEWPADAYVDAIVDMSSNHFIYAATVMRFIQFSSENPALSLVTVLEMPLPRDRTHNPLAHLDAVYSHIFSKARHIRAVKMILFAMMCIKEHSIFAAFTVEFRSDFEAILRLMGYRNIDVESLFADLVAIIRVNNGLLSFYHASLEDYLSDRSRSTVYHVNEEEIAVEVSSMCLRNIEAHRSSDPMSIIVLLLGRVQTPTPELSSSLLDASINRLRIIEWSAMVKLISHIERLYWEHDKDQFKLLLQAWSRFAHVNNSKYLLNWIGPSNPSASLYYKRYWTATEKSDEEVLPAVVGQDPIPKVKSEVGSGSREHNEDHPKLSKIRVKLHYQGGARGMTLSPDTPFSEFVSTVTTKFGKNSNGLMMNYKDEDGTSITLLDESDYEHAIETVLQSSKGNGEGKLEIWCRDVLP